jgi:hypothetical protein
MQRWVQYAQTLEVVVGLLLCSGLGVVPAMADTITYTFTGDVTKFEPHLSSRFQIPSTMSGIMIVDTVDVRPPNPSVGEYTIHSFTVTIGGYTATTIPGPGLPYVTIFATPQGFGCCEHMFRAWAFNFSGDLIGDSPENYLAPSFFALSLRGEPGATIFDSTALSSVVPSLSSFTGQSVFYMNFGPFPSGSHVAQVRGQVTSLTAVPLPAAGVLFGAGLVGLLGLAESRRQARRVPQV